MQAGTTTVIEILYQADPPNNDSAIPYKLTQPSVMSVYWENEMNCADLSAIIYAYLAYYIISIYYAGRWSQYCHVALVLISGSLVMVYSMCPEVLWHC